MFKNKLDNIIGLIDKLNDTREQNIECDNSNDYKNNKDDFEISL